MTPTATDYGVCPCGQVRQWHDVDERDDDGLCGACSTTAFLEYVEDYAKRHSLTIPPKRKETR